MESVIWNFKQLFIQTLKFLFHCLTSLLVCSLLYTDLIRLVSLSQVSVGNFLGISNQTVYLLEYIVSQMKN